MPRKRKLGIAAAALLGLAAGAGRAAAQQPTPTRVPAPANKPVQSPGNAIWAETPADARARAAKEKKLVFIEFDRKDCGYCQRMDALLYPAFDFEALLLSMVPVKVEFNSPAGKELALRYGVEDTPAILITSPEGRMAFLMQGFTAAPDFYLHARQDLKAYRDFVRKIERQDLSRLGAREAYDTGRELWQRSDPASARPRLQRALVAPKGTAKLRDAALELLAAVELDLGQTASSRETINRLIAVTKDAEKREEAEIFRAQIPLAENKPQEAFDLFQKFRKDHPRSKHLAKVDAFLARMTGPPPSQ